MAKVSKALLVLLALVLAGCAGQYPPTGGPIDTTPPKITMSSPTPNQLNFTSREIRLKFDKYMVRRTVESAIFFPPYSLDDLKFDWSGKEVSIKVEKPLAKDRTYILTIGARAQDDHGNYLGKAINIVFSTGAQIDTGMISGQIYAPKPEPYTVAAYQVTPDIDTLRPYLTLPRYITQSDDSGRYVLQGLADGKYRLICFDDQMRNFLYAPQIDLYSSAVHDVEVTQTDRKVPGVDFIVAKEDTSRPQLYSASLANDGLILLKFSEPLDTSYLSPSYFVVRDSATDRTLPVDFAARLESNQYNVVIRTTEPIKFHRKYFITATDSLRDTYHNLMSVGNNMQVFLPDSVSSNVAPYYFNFPDSLKGVTTYDTVFCQFVIPSINGVRTNPSVTLLDSVGKALPGLIGRASGTVFSVDLNRLKPSEWYTLNLDYNTDSSGTQIDSVVKRSFMTVDSSLLGELEGNVTPVIPGRRVIVAAMNERGKVFYTHADSDGAFRMDGILSGVYNVRAYVQHGRGMTYFNGRSFPYRFAEPFGVYPNDVKIRARWTTEGVVINLH